MAVTNAWKEAFDGAMPTLPFHFASVNVVTSPGTSAALCFWLS